MPAHRDTVGNPSENDMARLWKYTNMPAAIHMLQTKSISLLNPTNWDDKNDVYFMEEYKRIKTAKTLLASCFAEKGQQFQHWSAFSKGQDGLCIEFDRSLLLSTFNGDNRISSGSMHYRSIKKLKSMRTIPANLLPFLKRSVYSAEHEFRVIYLDEHEDVPIKIYPIEINWIIRITLSPWMPPTFKESIRSAIRGLDGCAKVDIRQSTLNNNAQWKSCTKKAV
jgi:hypothetical protein